MALLTQIWFKSMFVQPLGEDEIMRFLSSLSVTVLKKIIGGNLVPSVFLARHTETWDFSKQVDLTVANSICASSINWCIRYDIRPYTCFAQSNCIRCLIIYKHQIILNYIKIKCGTCKTNDVNLSTSLSGSFFSR